MTRQVTPFHFIGSREAGGREREMAAGEHGSRGERGAGENTHVSRGKKAQKQER